MAKGEAWTYRPLAVRRHASNMKAIVACLFGVVVLTGITGHLFSRREATTTSPPPSNPHHEALAKLIRTSEDAFGWIGNKTLDSINNIKNLTASAVTPESPLVVQKNKFLNWIRGVSNYNSSASGAESPETEVPEVPEDSGESVVIAHRTPGHGFSWGPPQGNRSEEGRVTPSPPGLLHAAGRRAHSLLSYLYQTSRNFTRRGKDILQSGIDKVKTAKESLKTKMLKRGEKYLGAPPGEPTTTTTTSAPDGPCEDVTDKVCAVDWDRNVFTIFQNDCWARVYNQLHGTNFIIHDSDVCINLFADRPENYQKIETPVM